MADQRRRDIEPPELAALTDLSERPRAGEWSLRAALTRYAQPEPQRVADLLDLVRRIDVVLPGLLDVAEREGPELWAALAANPTDDPPSFAVGLLQTMAVIDGFADELVAWARDPAAAPRPDARVDAVIAEVRDRLAALGVPEQERPGPPPGRRGRG